MHSRSVLCMTGHYNFYLMYVSITSQMLSAFVALSLCFLSVDFNFYNYSFGGGFRLLLRGFRISALDFDI